MTCETFSGFTVRGEGISSSAEKAVGHAIDNVRETGRKGCVSIGTCTNGQSCGFRITQIQEIQTAWDAEGFWKARVSVEGRCECVDPTM